MILSQIARAQEVDYDAEHQESTLPNFSRVHSNFEFYSFNGGERAVHWVTNGKLELGDRDYLNLEMIWGYYNKEGKHAWTPGDFSLAYSRNYYSSKFGDSGWQGWSPTVKLILPTGNPEYAAIFGHWILEPSFQYTWLLNDDRFFIRNRWRVNFPLANTNDWPEPPIFLRFEPQIGFENSKFWASATMDNRMVFNMDAYVIFGRLDAGYKISKKSGINVFYTERLREKVLFKKYAGVSFYYNF
ncbi:hypothetical protein OU798_14570 [Prolixibacteraceae bacterium Z1-6]|uniref:Uncharacterized protein n=1 Tax=Draconibacterium aestuarii TaxID=2998507 RepID=A0A9X3F887_9BACT|nr:hypothetical protein [Prolixibacteraceae bacterium Z1-6]